MATVRHTTFTASKIAHDISTAENLGEALKLGRLDWDVVKIPATFQGSDGRAIVAPECFLTARSDLDANDPNRILGSVGNGYTPIQNREAFGVIEDVIKLTGAKYETAGVLYGGASVWMMLELPSKMTVVGDKLAQHVLIRNAHDCTGSMEIVPTLVRIWCANQMATVLRTAGRNKISIRHTANSAERIAEVKDAMNTTGAIFGETQKAYEKLAATPVSKRFEEAFINALFPIAKGTKHSTRTENVRTDIRRLFNGGQPGANTDAMRGTAYGLLNAVTDYASHTKGVRVTGAVKSIEEARLVSVMFGSAATLREQATNLLLDKLDLAGSNDVAELASLN